MGGSHLRDDPDGGAADGGKCRDLARRAHAQLQHEQVGGGRRLEQRERQPDVVVEVPGRGMHGVGLRRNQSHHVPRGCLPAAAGDGHNMSTEAAANVGSKAVQRCQSVRHQKHAVRPAWWGQRGDNGAGAPTVARICQKVMPVKPVALQRHEPSARRHLPRVRDDGAVRPARHKLPACGGRELRRLPHHALRAILPRLASREAPNRRAARRPSGHAGAALFLRTERQLTGGPTAPKARAGFAALVDGRRPGCVERGLSYLKRAIVGHFHGIVLVSI
mmetsp:Transcript_10316/g.26457  ORF Transcript_10316/g.26457 Transcript_10316/m.26457 type:complete len:276 (+) Transcript_10316:274-1101(+)